MADMRTLGSSGLAITPLVLGGNVFGWNCRPPEAFAVLDAFVDGGGVMIDTADVYSAWLPGYQGGESETVIGQWLATSGRRNDLLIATKVGMLAGEGGEGLKPARIAAAIDASLKRLGTDRIDLYFAHRDDPDTPLEDTLGAFHDLVEAGKVRAIGASNYAADRLDEALAVAETNTLTPYTVLQPELNLVDREKFEGPLQHLCIARDVGVVTYFALAQGFLSGKYRSEADLGKSERGVKMTRPPAGGARTDDPRRDGRRRRRNRRIARANRARLECGAARRYRADRQRDHIGAGSGITGRDEAIADRRPTGATRRREQGLTSA